MAQIWLTSEAVCLVERKLREDVMRYPILSVGWWKGQHDNARGPAGEVIWNQLESPKWVAYLSDWEAHKEVGVEAHCVSITGINVYLDESARKASGTLCIGAQGNRFVVDRYDA
jgi:hypothetical protein